MVSLNDFKAIVRTDKYNDWSWEGPGTGHDYVGMFYDTICRPMRESATAILEIGIMAGHSHLLWSCFFPNARVYGADIKPPPFPNHNRIVLLGNTDAYQESMVKVFRAFEPNGYDMIVDDGPHHLSTQMYFIEHYWPLVKKGGYMVIEDVVSFPACEQVVKTCEKLGPTAGFYSQASSPGNDIHAVVVQKPQ